MADQQTRFIDRLKLDAAAGTWMDQTRRYLLVRPDTLMGMFRKLPEPARQQALEALALSVFEHGADSARAYRAMGGTGDKLIDMIAETAPQLGWGQWRFAREEAGLRLAVSGSPFAEGHGPSDEPVCHAIKGMLRAVATLAFATPMAVSESACASMGAGTCSFYAWPEAAAAL